MGNAEISFTLKNEGSITETFNYQFVEQLDWFEDFSGSIEIEPGSAETITFNGTTSNSAINSNFELIGQIKIPELVSNCEFGGKDGNILYITATTSLYSINLNQKG